MTTERWRRLKELYAATEELDSAGLENFLNALDDAELACELREMLAAGQSSGFLDRPVMEWSGPETANQTRQNVFSPGERLCRRFEIVRFIAHGGMGEVYEAYDTELREKVALKTVRADLGSDERILQGFRREVRRARAITSRHVCRVHDLFTHQESSDSAPVSFFSMRLLEGESLQSRIRREGRLKPEDALRLLRQIAEGVDAAHREGIVHGDLKSANILLSPGEDGEWACITDFGLAKAITSGDESAESMSEVSLTGGTPLWMAPEQLLGCPADRRSDVYAFGLIAYEMATGRLPFQGGEWAEQVRRRLSGAPIPPSQSVPELGRDWDTAIVRCLNRDPARRPASCGATLAMLAPTRDAGGFLTRRTVTIAALSCASIGAGLAVAWRPFERWFATAFHTGASSNSLAVLPFQRLGPTPEYFSDGFTEELLHALGQVRGLRVVGPESAFQFKNSELAPQVIGRKLGVRYVLMGSVRRMDAQLRVIARLVDAEDGSQVWSRDVTRNENQMFLIRDDLTRMLAGELNLNLAAMQTPAQTIDATGLSARDLYWTGRLYFRQRTDEGVRRSLDYFRGAVAKDPKFALAYCGLADALFVFAERALLSPDQALAQALQSARTAVNIDATLPDAWTSLAQVTSIYVHNLDEAERYFRRALELNPQFSPAAQWYSYQLVKQRRFADSTEKAEAAVADDPLSQAANINLAVVYLYSGQYDRATQQCRKLTQMDPQLFFEHPMMAIVFARKGLIGEALHEMELIPPERKEHRITLRCWVEVYATAGMMDRAREAMDRLLEAYRKGGIPESYVAAGYASMGETRNALEWLKRALNAQDAFASVANAYPAFDSLRADPEFTELMLKLGIKSYTR